MEEQHPSRKDGEVALRNILFVLLFALLACLEAQATIFSQLHGVVHDPQHRPILNASVSLKAVHSGFVASTKTNGDGGFIFESLPLGEYLVTVSVTGFQIESESITLVSGTAPVLHFMLTPGAVKQSVTVQNPAGNVDTATTSTLVSREEIARTPGSDRTNSMAMITNFVPGAYMTHDMLHMRGGHQTGWQIDGVLIPNTNIASNVGAQIDPKDIDSIEVERGSYAADIGDRTYGVFNVVPRNGFERNREAELLLSAGSFNQTNDQLSLGDHSERLAWYASLNGSRSDYGLAPPIGKVHHDASNGYGGFTSLIYNRTAEDQFRLVGQLREDFFQLPYDPDPNSLGNTTVFDSHDLRDTEKERDGYLLTSWLHSFHAGTVLQLSPFYHYNSSNYHPNPLDLPNATTDDRRSQYEGGQASVTSSYRTNTLQAGFYGFAQQDAYKFAVVFNDLSATNFSKSDSATGKLAELYASDNLKLRSWLTLIGGLRYSHFSGQLTEDVVYPRIGVAVEIPRLHWVLRGFYGRFYQPPPLLTASGPVLAYATSQNTAIVPLKGERDEEHQIGLRIPLRGWVVDVDTFRTRVNNFLDHSSLGESSIYFPVTVDGALVRGWELSLHSPRLWHTTEAHLAYSNQIAEQRGAITGGLICSSACSFTNDYTPVDHDQRNTLNVGLDLSLPRHAFASTNVAYGSGFTNGTQTTQYPGDYLPQHTMVDLSLGKEFGERVKASVSLINAANRRVLLDNSVTYGGLHYNDPRQILGEVRYRFKF